jgi:hypothetical protein
VAPRWETANRFTVYRTCPLATPEDRLFFLLTYLKGSVSFRDKLRNGQASDYQRLYQTAEIRSRSAATRCTWMTRRRASETLWLM